LVVFVVYVVTGRRLTQVGFLEMALRAAEEMQEGEKRGESMTEATKVPLTLQFDDGQATTKTTKGCPAPKMPPGVTLIEWNPKSPPVGIFHCSVVNDVEGLVADRLTQLGELLNSQAESETTRELRDLVDILEQCGVIVQVRKVSPWPKGGRKR
jgi:hypothetical protein